MFDYFAVFPAQPLLNKSFDTLQHLSESMKAMGLHFVRSDIGINFERWFYSDGSTDVAVVWVPRGAIRPN